MHFFLAFKKQIKQYFYHKDIKNALQSSQFAPIIKEIRCSFLSPPSTKSGENTEKFKNPPASVSITTEQGYHRVKLFLYIPDGRSLSAVALQVKVAQAGKSL